MVGVDPVAKCTERIDQLRAHDSRHADSQRSRAILSADPPNGQYIVGGELVWDRCIDARLEKARKDAVLLRHLKIDFHRNLKLVFVQRIAREHGAAWIARLWKAGGNARRCRTDGQQKPSIRHDPGPEHAATEPG